MKVYIYIVGASDKPDSFPSSVKVPYKLNESLIFFGPCKDRIRKFLFEKYIRGKKKLPDDIFLVGINGKNKRDIRKIIWVGKIKSLFTFEEAYEWVKKTSNPEIQKLMADPKSPLHLQPIRDMNGFGYKLRSDFHNGLYPVKYKGKQYNIPKWVADIIDPKYLDKIRITLGKDPSVILTDTSDRSKVFSKDCCFLCENIFFVERKGLSIDQKILLALQKAQQRKKIDKNWIFGKPTPRGYHVELKDEEAEKFITYIQAMISKLNNK